MMTSRSVVSSAIVIVSVVIASACRDAASPATPRNLVAHARSSNHDLERGNITSAQLHKKNPMDFVGVGHNLIVDRFRREMASGSVSFATACERVAAWLDEPESLSELSSRLPPDARSKMKESLASRLPQCRHPARRVSAPVRTNPSVLRLAALRGSL